MKIRKHIRDLSITAGHVEAKPSPPPVRRALDQHPDSEFVARLRHRRAESEAVAARLEAERRRIDDALAQIHKLIRSYDTVIDGERELAAIDLPTLTDR